MLLCLLLLDQLVTIRVRDIRPSTLRCVDCIDLLRATILSRRYVLQAAGPKGGDGRPAMAGGEPDMKAELGPAEWQMLEDLVAGEVRMLATTSTVEIM